MPMTDDRLHRELATAVFLAAAFFCMLAGPFTLAHAMLNGPDSAFANGKAVALAAQHLWPMAVAATLSCAFFALRCQDWGHGFALPVAVTIAAAGINGAIAYYLYFLGIFISLFMEVLAWFLVFGCYWLARRLLIRQCGQNIRWSHSLLEHAGLFALFAVPEILRQFLLFLGAEWYYDLM